MLFTIIALFCFNVVFGTMPVEWQDKVHSLNAFYAPNDTDPIEANGYPGIYLPMIGNGYLSQERGVRSNTMYISGIFNNETTTPSHRARIPAVFDVTVNNSTTTGVLSDISRGTYHRQGILNNYGNSTYELRWYAHRVIRYLYVLEVVINVADGLPSASLTFNSSLSTSADFNFEEDVTTYAPIVVKCGNTTIPETPTGDTHSVCMATQPLPSVITVTSFSSGNTLTFITAFRTSLDVPSGASIAAAAAQEFNYGMELVGADSLYSSHVDGWNRLWTTGVEVEGRRDVAIAINASLYAILSSVRDDWPYGLAPGGLTNYYNGHSFWDTETWMYPPMLYLHPNISLSLLQYRYDRLDGARQKALSYSPQYNGTMFPWESAFSGVETCPTFAATGLREIHISGDIAFAVWQEWCMRQNEEWLRETGYPILIGVADFWVSRSNYSSDCVASEEQQCYAHINGVIPPDEYVDHVNDSVYTNFVAAKSLNYAVDASVLLNITCERCSLYSQLANDLVILFNETLGIHPEYYNYSGQVVKQADVVLLHYPLEMNMSRETQLRDCEYYAIRTDINGPAMTWGMFAINYLDLQNFTSAAHYFNMSFQDNLHEPLQVWTETPSGNAVNFITGAGGFLQTVVMGYPGMRLTLEGITMSPVCPEGITYLKVREFQYLGNTIDLEYWCHDDVATTAQMYPYRVKLTLKNAIATASVLQVTDLDTDTTSVLSLNVPLTYDLSTKAYGSRPSSFVLAKSTATSSESSDSNTLSVGAIAGIVIGSVCGVALLGVLIYYLMCGKGTQNASSVKEKLNETGGSSSA